MKRVQVQTIQTPTSILELKKVKLFLDSVGRNSSNSKRIYGIGLEHFQAFVKTEYSNDTVETILTALASGKIDVYSLMDAFVSYLVTKKLSANSISLYIAALRSYLAYHDIDIVQTKFKRKVRMPKGYKEEAEPLDSSDIRKILLSCSNRRLKAYLLVLASSGCRAVEALAIRNKDIDFSSSPTKIHIRKEYTKTRTARTVYISDEAATYLKNEWLVWKYARRRGKVIESNPDDIVFSNRTSHHPEMLYTHVLNEFGKVLKIIGLDTKKENNRNKLALHSFRRFVKTTVATYSNSDYSEWLLGHSGSPYFSQKAAEKSRIYADLMRHLTFLDYTHIEATGKSNEAQLAAAHKRIAELESKLRQKDIESASTREDLDAVLKVLRKEGKLPPLK